jgi:hypothetical protein
MSSDNLARYGAATGIVFVIAVIVGFAIVVPTPPDTDSSAATFARYYSDHQDAIRAGLTILGVGIFFFIWFLGSLRGALATAEGGTARLSSVAYGAGLVATAFFVVGLAAGLTAAYRPDEVDPGLTRALNDFFAVIGAPAAGAFVAFFAATALVGFRHGALPGWAAGLSAIAAIGQVPAIGTALTTTGVFAADGALGLFIPVITFVVGLLAISIALVRNPVPGAATTRSTT